MKSSLIIALFASAITFAQVGTAPGNPAGTGSSTTSTVPDTTSSNRLSNTDPQVGLENPGDSRMETDRGQRSPNGERTARTARNQVKKSEPKPEPNEGTKDKQ